MEKLVAGALVVPFPFMNLGYPRIVGYGVKTSHTKGNLLALRFLAQHESDCGDPHKTIDAEARSYCARVSDRQDWASYRSRLPSRLECARYKTRSE